VFATGVAGNGLVSDACCDSNGYGIGVDALSSGEQNYFTCLPAWIDYFTSLQEAAAAAAAGSSTTQAGYKTGDTYRLHC